MADTPYRPTLPPKAGYVEVGGQYVPTDETRILLEREERIIQLEEEITQLKSGNMEFQTELYSRLVAEDIIGIEKVPDRIKDEVTVEIGKIKDINDIKLKEGGTP